MQRPPRGRIRSALGRITEGRGRKTEKRASHLAVLPVSDGFETRFKRDVDSRLVQFGYPSLVQANAQVGYSQSKKSRQVVWPPIKCFFHLRLAPARHTAAVAPNNQPSPPLFSLFPPSPEQQAEERLAQVRRELAWGAERQAVALRKARARFIDDVEHERVPLWDCRVRSQPPAVSSSSPPAPAPRHSHPVPAHHSKQLASNQRRARTQSGPRWPATQCSVKCKPLRKFARSFSCNFIHFPCSPDTRER